MINKIWEILTTLTEEAQKKAIAKCKDSGFDPNRGVVSLDESFINLSSSRDILKDAIENKKLIQLPITVQKILLQNLEAIQKSLTGLTAGTDEVVNLAAAIEQLNAAIWQYGLHNLSEEVLGYQTKLNQLKNQELELKRLHVEAENALAQKIELEKLLGEVRTSTEALKKTENDADVTGKQIAEQLKSVTTSAQEAGALLKTVEQNEKNSTQLFSTTKTSNAEVVALEQKTKEFFAQIDEHRTKLSTAVSEAATTVSQNKEQTATLIENLKKLEEQIKDQIQKATGFSLFHSFQTRQGKVAWSKRFWAVILTLLVSALIGLTWHLASTLAASPQNLNPLFFLKLSISLPIIYAIGFCQVQYSRERRLEEEYAFKSNISISLIPYQELVAKLVNKANPAEVEKFTAFIVESVNKVFTSPTEKVFEHEGKHHPLNEKQLKTLTELVGHLARAAKP